MIKLIVLNKAEFEVSEEAGVKEMTAFLISQGFDEIGNWQLENKDLTGQPYNICTANYYGRKKQFKMPTFDCSYYGDWIKRQGQGFARLVELNANELNELCARNGKER